jgi:AhpD family alkylhydroperoxidase
MKTKEEEIMERRINGCACCIAMHWQDPRAAGEMAQRLCAHPA